MEFDKSKVYTAVNADEVKVGSKGYFADNLRCLQKVVQIEDVVVFGEIEEICSTEKSCRFKGVGESSYNLFYLVEEAKEKTIRPYKDMDEMIKDFKMKYRTVYADFSMPLIWLKDKAAVIRVVTSFYKKGVTINGNTMSLEQLLDSYIYLDGSPCGIEE